MKVPRSTPKIRRFEKLAREVTPWRVLSRPWGAQQLAMNSEPSIAKEEWSVPCSHARMPSLGGLISWRVRLGFWTSSSSDIYIEEYRAKTTPTSTHSATDGGPRAVVGENQRGKAKHAGMRASTEGWLALRPLAECWKLRLAQQMQMPGSTGHLLRKSEKGKAYVQDRVQIR